MQKRKHLTFNCAVMKVLEKVMEFENLFSRTENDLENNHTSTKVV